MNSQFYEEYKSPIAKEASVIDESYMMKKRGYIFNNTDTQKNDDQILVHEKNSTIQQKSGTPKDKKKGKRRNISKGEKNPYGQVMKFYGGANAERNWKVMDATEEYENNNVYKKNQFKKKMIFSTGKFTSTYLNMNSKQQKSLEGLQEQQSYLSKFSNTSSFPVSKASPIVSNGQPFGFSQVASSKGLLHETYKYQVLKGNNPNIVQRVLQNRYWWGELTTYAIPQFKWSPCSIKADFPRLNQQKQMINHFEFHREITRKNELFFNLNNYFTMQNLNVFDYVPISYFILISEGKMTNLESAVKKFEQVFELLDKNKYAIIDMNRSSKNSIETTSFNQIEKLTAQKIALKNHIYKPNPQKLAMPQCHFIGANMWVLKTTCQNRGRGIHVFKTLKQLKTILRQYVSNNEDANQVNKGGSTSNGIQYIPKSMNFIIQKYIERPMLINKRKFDIRVWVLVNQDMEVFFFKEGYLRTSCSEYKIDNCEDQYVHLTNNAVQRNAATYGEFEDGNQLSFKDLQKYITEHYKGKVKIDVYDDLVEDMKYLVAKTMDSVKKKLNPENRKICFELFGFDFMIDQDFTVWLIECNTNPCLDESSQLLKAYLPRMLDDAFRLTIDKVFPNPKDAQPSNKGSSPFKVYKGLSSVGRSMSKKRDNNMDKIMDMQQNKTYLKVNERRIRSENLIYLAETNDFYLTSNESYKKVQQERRLMQPLINPRNNSVENPDQLQISGVSNGIVVDEKYKMYGNKEMKISDKINQVLTQEAESNKIAYSYEYFPPRTDQGVENLIDRIERMGTTNPLWVDCTWNAGGRTSDITLDLCSHIQNFSGLDVLMHITCTYMTKELIVNSLEKAKTSGIRNLLVLRGDPPQGSEWTPIENGFHHAVDLIKFIKEKYGDYFCIGCAGYPEVHLEQPSREADIKYLKDKVDAGAEFVITQLFYDNQIFFKWVDDCRAAGINCQIIPGMMPILGYERFHRMIGFCKTKVPQTLFDALEPIKNDEEEVRKFGIQFGIQQCQEIIDHGWKFLHFYTLNLERSVIEIIKGLGILDKQRDLPFKTSSQRENEEVRPVFWAIKPKSYIARTQQWDEYPNGRWGLSKSAAFGEPDQYKNFAKKLSFNYDELKKLWGESVENYDQVIDVFVSFLQGKIRKYPFSDGSLQPETDTIMTPLIHMNQNKIFTINSQPRVNGAPSTDPKFGWGPKNGFVYQKAYYEFFIPKELLEPLIQHLNKYEMITYQAINAKGDTILNVDKNDVNAITWGVFRSKEILQPTVVDHNAFLIWKDEIFKQWTDEWAIIYGTDSPSYQFLTRCYDTFYLVNIVDNDYMNGDLDRVMDTFIQENEALIKSL